MLFCKDKPDMCLELRGFIQNDGVGEDKRKLSKEIQKSTNLVEKVLEIMDDKILFPPSPGYLQSDLALRKNEHNLDKIAILRIIENLLNLHDNSKSNNKVVSKIVEKFQFHHLKRKKVENQST